MAGRFTSRRQGDQEDNVLVRPLRVLVDRTVEAPLRAVVSAQRLPLRLGNCCDVHHGHAAEKLLRFGFYQAETMKHRGEGQERQEMVKPIGFGLYQAEKIQHQRGMVGSVKWRCYSSTALKLHPRLGN